MTRAGNDRGADAAGPSMQDVADRAGVAIGTVSNVLNRPEVVREATRHKVEAAIDELGFVRNSAARSLAVGSSKLIGLVLVDLANSFFVDIARGVEAATSVAGYHLLLANSDVDGQRQDQYLKVFDEARAAGVILAPLDSPLPAAHLVRSHGRPIVLVNVPAADKALCNVLVDDRQGGIIAGSHLIEQGCRRLAFVGGPLRLRAVANRLEGARQTAREADIPLIEVETHSLQAEHGRTAAVALLTADDPVDGVICCSDSLAMGVIGAAVALGVAVPDDLAVMGYDDNLLAADSVIPISTIGQPGRQIGEAAARLLLQEISPTPHRHETIMMEPHLVTRRSSLRRDG